MDGGVETIGDAITGAVVARPVEPAACEAAGRAGACLNCGTALVGDYCHRCGQKGQVHRALSAFWHDLLHGVLHFEGKIWRTLPMLAWRPGELTRRYVEGERARFVSPLALFLFSVFLMFAIVGTIGGPAYSNRDAPAPEEEHKLVGESPFDSLPILEREAKNEREENVRELAALVRAREKLLAADKNSQMVDADIANLRREMALEERVFQQAIQLQRAADRRRVAHEKPVEGIQIHPQGSNSSLSYLKGFDLADRNPDLLFYKMQTNAYKFSWALIPLLVPFVSLLFLKRRRDRQYKLYDHAVFVTYFLTFISLFVIAFTILKLTGLRGSWALLPFTVLPIHTYKHLKDGYSLARLGAIWRTIALLIVSILGGGLFFLALLLLGALG